MAATGAVALVGYDAGVEGAFANALGVGTNNQSCGALFANRTGCLSFTPNSVSGSVSNGASRVGSVSGTLKANSGTYQPAAGIYSGSFSVFDGADCDGTLKAILAPDGTISLYILYASGLSDGGIAVTSSGAFTVATPRGSHFTGAISISQRLISGQFIHGCDNAMCGGPLTFTR